MNLTICLIFFVIFVLFWIFTYNNLVRLRQNVREAWSAVETELQRRYDLIPNLVETVKAYASHETKTLTSVVEARNQAINVISSPEKANEANKVLSGALHQLFALSESYPDLKANTNFLELQNQLGTTETNIAQARRFYNANVRELNTAIEAFPSNLVARQGSFRPEPFFGITDADAFQAPKVSFEPQEKANEDGQTIRISEKQREP